MNRRVIIGMDNERRMCVMKPANQMAFAGVPKCCLIGSEVSMYAGRG